MSSNHHSRAHLVLPMRANGHQARPVVPMKTDGHLRAYLALPMKTYGHRQLCLVHPESSSCRHQPLGVLARKCKGMGFAGTEQMEVLLPMPLQASAEKSNAR
jgi:hypothetical protein